MENPEHSSLHSRGWRSVVRPGDSRQVVRDEVRNSWVIPSAGYLSRLQTVKKNEIRLYIKLVYHEAHEDHEGFINRISLRALRGDILTSTRQVWISEREEAWRPEEQERDGWYRPRQLENRHDGVGRRTSRQQSISSGRKAYFLEGNKTCLPRRARSFLNPISLCVLRALRGDILPRYNGRRTESNETIDTIIRGR